MFNKRIIEMVIEERKKVLPHHEQQLVNEAQMNGLTGFLKFSIIFITLYKKLNEKIEFVFNLKVQYRHIVHHGSVSVFTCFFVNYLRKIGVKSKVFRGCFNENKKYRMSSDTFSLKGLSNEN
jgi:hypothetical protein